MKTAVKNSVKNVVVNNTKVATKVKAINKDLPLTKVVAQVEKKPSLHKLLLIANAEQKAEFFSLSGAIKRYRLFAIEKKLMLDFVTSLKIEEALKYDNLLPLLPESCKEKKRFTFYQIGQAVNKYLKSEL